jgi:hypothetical protein
MAWLPFFEARFRCARSSALAPLAVDARGGSFLRRWPNLTDAPICHPRRAAMRILSET